jgi:hypothetical protein
MTGPDAPPTQPAPASAATTEIPYQEVTDAEFSKAAIAVFSIARTADGVELNGPCPRCGHAMYWLVLDDERVGFHRAVVTGEYTGEHTGPAGAETTDVSGSSEQAEENEPMICTCSVEHPQHPAGRTGCGAGWNVRLI